MTKWKGRTTDGILYGETDSFEEADADPRIAGKCSNCDHVFDVGDTSTWSRIV